MSKFLVISQGGDGMGQALWLQKEGHDARLWIAEGDQAKIGTGMVTKADDGYDFGQTIVCDATGFGALMDTYRDAGRPIFGGSSFADRLEMDRTFGEEVMSRAEIDTPKSIAARSWQDAAKAVESLGKHSSKVVLKPEGALSGVLPSYVAKSVEDALGTLQQWEKESSGDMELCVQEFIEGVAVSTEGWFDGKEWIEGLFNRTLERKQLMNDDLGPSGGCTGNLVWSIDSKDPIVRELLLKLTDTLQEHRYVGPIDINCVINEQGFYGLEFTPRFGYDAFPTLLHCLFPSDYGAFVDSVARGSRVGFERISLLGGFGAGVRLSIPPWPSKVKPKPVDVKGFKDEDLDSFYPYGLMLDGDNLVSCGDDGSLGVVSQAGGSISEAFARCYEIIARLEISNVQYRTDLAHTFLEEYNEVQRILEGESEQEGWIGVDLDGTLATYHGWSDEIGQPIPKMVQRVKRWVSEGKQVRILTARGTVGGESGNKYEQMIKVHDWVNEHIGTPLFVTDRKDPLMIRLYDDRVRQVEAGTGELVVS